VIAHIGATGIEDSKELARHAFKSGAWGIGVMNPVFFKPAGVEDLADYCKEIADCAPELPFYFYHIPAFTGDTLPLVPLLKIVSKTIPNFGGIKYTHENLYQFNQCMQFENGKFEMLHGQDETLILGLTLGAKGGVGELIIIVSLFTEVLSMPLMILIWQKQKSSRTNLRSSLIYL